jgi:TolA-binding protein
MGFRFHKSFKLAPGVKVNLSKKGLGMSVGTKGARVGIGPRGSYSTVGIPGTGMSWTNYGSKKTSEFSPQSAESFQSSDPFSIPKEELQSRSSIGCLVLFVGVICIFINIWLGLVIIIASFATLFTGSGSKVISLYKNANNFAKQGNLSSAAKALEEALQLKPQLNEAKFQLANLYAEMTDYQNALKWLQECLKIQNDEQIKFNMAICYSELGQKEKSLDILQSLSMEFKQELRYIIAVGMLLLDMDKPELALKILETGPTRKRNMDDQIMIFRYLLGLTYKKLGNKKKAITQLQKVYVYNRNYEDTSSLLTELGALPEN